MWKTCMMNKPVIRKEALDALYKIKCNLQMMDDSQSADKMIRGVWLAENAIRELPAAQHEDGE